MTSKKRKYGDLSARALPSENDDVLLDEVFAAFTGTRPTGAPADDAEQHTKITSESPNQVEAEDTTAVPQYRSTAAENTPVLESKFTGQLSTSIKDNKNDDEAFAELVALLKHAALKVTGKGTAPGDSARWKEVAELLATEPEIASARTTVTNAPAFLAEHLRRRLRKADAGQIEREVREAVSGEAKSSSAGPAKPKLNGDQLQEQVNLMVLLMRDGNSAEDLDTQFAANFRPVQWHMIRSMAMTQFGAGNRREEYQQKGEAK